MADAEPPEDGYPVYVDDAAPLVEARRAGQEALVWQAISFFFVVQGILIAGVVSHGQHRDVVRAMATIGFASSVIFAQMYARARWFELTNSRWLKAHGRIDHISILEDVEHRGYKREFWEHKPTAWFAKIPAKYMWPAVFFTSALLWALYGFGVLG